MLLRKQKEDWILRKCHWKKGAAAAALAVSLFAHAGAANAATVYRATDDDTFWSLSKRFNVNLNVLMKANPKVDPLNIYQGVKIVIPDAKPKQVKPAEKAKPSAVSAKQMSLMSKSSDEAKEDRNVIHVNGRQHAYSGVIQAKASAYTAAASENGGWAGLDYFGNRLKVGTIAVDPKRIPLGTKVYITGYDYDGLPKGGMIAVASDVGGAIKGDRIDIFVPDSQPEARQFGFQYVKVYILD
jgi:3D (Asp-Asp-Asp) domain-containing protein/LysM repeat protein